MMKIPNTDAAIMPPNTGVPTAWRAQRPGPLRNDQGQQPEDEGEAGHHDRAEPQACRFDGGRIDVLPELAPLHRERNDQNAVLGGERDQHHEPDLRIDIEAQSGQLPARRWRRAPRR